MSFSLLLIFIVHVFFNLFVLLLFHQRPHLNPPFPSGPSPFGRCSIKVELYSIIEGALTGDSI